MKLREYSLASLLPLWRLLHEEGVTAAVTPALDYVGGLELQPLDIGLASPDRIASLGEQLRSFVASLDDGTSLLFLYRVDNDASADIAAYEEYCAKAEPEALRTYVRERAAWLHQRSLRRVRLYVFFSQGGAGSSLSRGLLGVPLVFGRVERAAETDHKKALEALARLRNKVSGRLSQLGMKSAELSVRDFRQLFYELLNPARARQRLEAPAAVPRDTLWDASTVATHGAWLAEYTEAEMLCHEGLQEHRGHLVQGDVYRRVCTLKTLPEGGTYYADSEALLGLVAPTRNGGAAPCAYTLAVAVTVQDQRRARFRLDVRNGLVESLQALQRRFGLGDASASKRMADAAQQGDIHALFGELQQMSSKLVSVSTSILLEAPSLEDLDAQTEAARGAFNRLGNSELLVEDVAQLPTFLAMLPTAGAYQVRQKGATSRNAADMLPVFGRWRGTKEAASLFMTPTGEALRFDFFDEDLTTAHHGLVAADTGSGKSFTFGLFLLDAIAAGREAVLVDNGGSWKRLTELCGGRYIAVDMSTSISPFVAYPDMLTKEGALDAESVDDVVRFLEVCVTDRAFPEFDKAVRPVVGRAVRLTYEAFRAHPKDKPLISHFRDTIRGIADTTTDAHDKRVCEDLCRRLLDFCEGTYADFLNRPSQLDFGARVLTFDMAAVSKSQTLKEVSLATIMQAVGNRVMRANTRRGVRTIVGIDEGHEYLRGGGEESFLAGAYRKYRKYGAAVWMISQQLADFERASCGPAILGNAKLQAFLRHDSGHDKVASYFNLTPRAAAAFKSLQINKGVFSDVLLKYGPAMAVARLAVHPLALWILTTDKADKDLLARAAEKNPQMTEWQLVQHLAARYPRGARGLPHVS